MNLLVYRFYGLKEKKMVGVIDYGKYETKNTIFVVRQFKDKDELFVDCYNPIKNRIRFITKCPQSTLGKDILENSLCNQPEHLIRTLLENVKTVFYKKNFFTKEIEMSESEKEKMLKLVLKLGF